MAPDSGRVLILNANAPHQLHRTVFKHESAFHAGRITPGGTLHAPTETRIDVERYVILHEIRDADDVSVIRNIEMPPHALSDMAFSPDGKTVITGSDDMLVRFWKAPEK